MPQGRPVVFEREARFTDTDQTLPNYTLFSTTCLSNSQFSVFFLIKIGIPGGLLSIIIIKTN